MPVGANRSEEQHFSHRSTKAVARIHLIVTRSGGWADKFLGL